MSTFLCDLILDDESDGLLDAPPCIPRLLEVICATNAGTAENAQVLLAPLVERLRGLTEALHQLDRRSMERREIGPMENSTSITRLCSWYASQPVPCH